MFNLWVNIYLCFVYLHIIYVMYISVFNVGRFLKCHWFALVTGRHCLQHFLSTFSTCLDFTDVGHKWHWCLEFWLRGKLFHVTTRKTQPWFTHVFCIIREQWKRLCPSTSQQWWVIPISASSVPCLSPSASPPCLSLAWFRPPTFFLFFSHHTFWHSKGALDPCPLSAH